MYSSSKSASARFGLPNRNCAFPTLQRRLRLDPSLEDFTPVGPRLVIGVILGVMAHSFTSENLKSASCPRGDLFW